MAVVLRDEGFRGNARVCKRSSIDCEGRAEIVSRASVTNSEADGSNSAATPNGELWCVTRSPALLPLHGVALVGLYAFPWGAF